MGSEDDIHRFMEIMVADFELRCRRANDRLFGGRIQLLPVEETLPE